MDFSGQREFAVRLGSQLASEPGNLFVGGLSVWTALALLLPGARGQTKENLASVLRLPVEDDDEAWIAPVKELTDSLTREVADNLDIEKRSSRLEVANALWLQEGYPVESDYVTKVIDGFQALIEELDFAGDREGACNTINRWADEKTHGKIPEVLSPTEISALTRFILSNATYFKDEWAEPFQIRETRDKPFHRPNGGQVRVPMMHREDELTYTQTRKFQAVELPYSREGLSMVVVLPKKIRKFEANFTPESYEGLIDSLQYSTLVHLDLPRFELRDDRELTDPLLAIGLTELFGLTADLSGISKEPDLFVDEVKHVTYVKADEQGTEAAAVTTIAVAATSAMHARKPRPKIMIVDRPFWFFIRDRKSGCLLFSGRVEDPS